MHRKAKGSSVPCKASLNPTNPTIATVVLITLPPTFNVRRTLAASLPTCWFLFGRLGVSFGFQMFKSPSLESLGNPFSGFKVTAEFLFPILTLLFRAHCASGASLRPFTLGTRPLKQNLCKDEKNFPQKHIII